MTFIGLLLTPWMPSGYEDTLLAGQVIPRQTAPPQCIARRPLCLGYFPRKRLGIKPNIYSHSSHPQIYISLLHSVSIAPSFCVTHGSNNPLRYFRYLSFYWYLSSHNNFHTPSTMFITNYIHHRIHTTIRVHSILLYRRRR